MSQVLLARRTAIALVAILLCASAAIAQPGPRRGRRGPGWAMAVAAVSAGDFVVLVEVHADTDRHCLLARVEVHKAGNLPGREFDMDPLLELADGLHVAVGLEQLVFGHFHRCLAPLIGS